MGRLREWGGTRWGVSCHTSLDSCWCGGRGTWQRRGHWDPFLEFLPIYYTFFSCGWTKLGRWGTFSKSSHFSPLHSIYKTIMSDSSKSKKCLGNGLSTSFHKEQKETGIPLPLKWLRSSLQSVIVFLLWIQQKMGRKEKYCPPPCRMRDHSSLSRG